MAVPCALAAGPDCRSSPVRAETLAGKGRQVAITPYAAGTTPATMARSDHAYGETTQAGWCVRRVLCADAPARAPQPSLRPRGQRPALLRHLQERHDIPVGSMRILRGHGQGRNPGVRRMRGLRLEDVRLARLQLDVEQQRLVRHRDLVLDQP